MHDYAGALVSGFIVIVCCFFFFQAEDGIRDSSVTGVQTCALPISDSKLLIAGRAVWDMQTNQLIATLQGKACRVNSLAFSSDGKLLAAGCEDKIGRASCRERV